MRKINFYCRWDLSFFIIFFSPSISFKEKGKYDNLFFCVGYDECVSGCLLFSVCHIPLKTQKKIVLSEKEKNDGEIIFPFSYIFSNKKIRST